MQLTITAVLLIFCILIISIFAYNYVQYNDSQQTATAMLPGSKGLTKAEFEEAVAGGYITGGYYIGTDGLYYPVTTSMSTYSSPVVNASANVDAANTSDNASVDTAATKNIRGSPSIVGNTFDNPKNTSIVIDSGTTAVQVDMPTQAAPNATATPVIAPPVAVGTTVALPTQTLGVERADGHCGASYLGAKCGLGRCCSIYGVCGGSGDPACQAGTNDPLYNGPNAIVAQQTASVLCSLDCNSPSVLSSAEYYYDNIGEFSNAYTMRPTHSVLSGPNTCDIAYDYIGNGRTLIAPAGVVLGSDKRRFTFTNTNGCNWQATSMGGNSSGTMA